MARMKIGFVIIILLLFRRGYKGWHFCVTLNNNNNNNKKERLTRITFTLGGLV